MQQETTATSAVRPSAAFKHGRLASAPPRRRRPPGWLHALLLAVAPLLVMGFYSVVSGAVERAAARRAAPAAHAQQPAAWECSALPGAALHSACRPTAAGDAAVPVRVSMPGG